MQPLLVSACLLGEPCRYDGKSKPSEVVMAFAKRWVEQGGRVVAVCPEQLGGLPTPRSAADLRGGDGHAVLDQKAFVRRVEDDGDVTREFVGGAKEAAEQAPNARLAILKARSPSCGVGWTEIDGKVAAGDGVFAALLRHRGVELCSDEQL